MNCYTRRGYDWADRFPTLVSAAQTINIESAIIDGELVVVDENGDTDFAVLESRGARILCRVFNHFPLCGLETPA